MNYTLLLVGAYLALTKLRPETQVDLKLWNSFKAEEGKEYVSQEIETLRKSIFAYNKQEVEDFNEKLANQLGFELELNHLADISSTEIKGRNGFKLPEGNLGAIKNEQAAEQFLADILNDNSTDVPDEVDWRQVPGRVSRVKNQGSCGSCWAFSSTGVLEGQEKVRSHLLRKRRGVLRGLTGDSLTELSEQNLVDCVKKDYGCNGGYMKDALEFVQEEGGIDDESSYPYEGRTRKCRFRKEKVAFSDSGAAILPTGDEEKLKEVVAKFGPVAVAIDASSIWFQFYRKGVYYNKHCKNKEDQLDHGVLVVGYGTDPKKGDYWIVKNSWGPKFGEAGYIRMARNRGNNCGIATAATIPTF